MKNICFFNHWHNGDVFAGKGWMQDIQRQYPNLNYAYSHINNAKVMGDLPMEHFHCDDLPEGLADRQWRKTQLRLRNSFISRAHKA